MTKLIKTPAIFRIFSTPKIGFIFGSLSEMLPWLFPALHATGQGSAAWVQKMKAIQSGADPDWKAFEHQATAELCSAVKQMLAWEEKDR